MPIYVYVCQKCGRKEEVIQPLDGPPATCQKCGDLVMEREISSTSFILKGSGWAKDGYTGGPK